MPIQAHAVESQETRISHLLPSPSAFGPEGASYHYLRTHLQERIPLSPPLMCRFGCFILPAFGGEEFVGLYTSWRTDSPSNKWFLATARANTNLFARLTSEHVSPTDESWSHLVQTQVTNFSPSVAEELSVTWNDALLTTKYASSSPSGVDGTTYVFFGWKQDVGYMYGTAWCPSDGFPRAMASTVEHLLGYVKEPTRKAADSTQQIRLAIKKVTASLADAKEEPGQPSRIKKADVDGSE